MTGSLQAALEYIRAFADSEAKKGRLFARLIKAYLINDPLYQNRFSAVHLWSKWAVPQDQVELPTGSRVWTTLRRSPLVGSDIDLTRPHEEGREILL